MIRLCDGTLRLKGGAVPVLEREYGWVMDAAGTVPEE